MKEGEHDRVANAISDLSYENGDNTDKGDGICLYTATDFAVSYANQRVIEELGKLSKELYSREGTDSYSARCLIYDRIK